MIVVDGLCKSYGEHEVLRNISFHISTGECVGLVGLNGVGKTTLINILLGITRLDSGLVNVFGEPSDRLSAAVRRDIGFVSGVQNGVPDDTKIKYLFDRHAAMYDIPHDEYIRHRAELSELLQIHDLYDEELRCLSLGQRMKCELALTLIQRPKLLILDEATVGLDSVSEQVIINVLKNLGQTGTTVIFSGHRMNEVEQLCDRLIMLHDRSVLYDGRLRDFMERYGGLRRISLECMRLPDLEDIPTERIILSDGRLVIEFDKNKISSAEIIRHLKGKCSRTEMESIKISEPRLEDCIKEIYTRRDETI